jgi:hypothetical protein
MGKQTADQRTNSFTNRPSGKFPVGNEGLGG